jgi:hypothetical protein
MANFWNAAAERWYGRIKNNRFIGQYESNSLLTKVTANHYYTLISS